MYFTIKNIQYITLNNKRVYKWNRTYPINNLNIESYKNYTM